MTIPFARPVVSTSLTNTMVEVYPLKLTVSFPRPGKSALNLVVFVSRRVKGNVAMR